MSKKNVISDEEMESAIKNVFASRPSLTEHLQMQNDFMKQALQNGTVPPDIKKEWVEGSIKAGEELINKINTNKKNGK